MSVGAVLAKSPRQRKPKGRRYVLVYHVKPFTANEVRRWYWAKTAKETKAWRRAFMELAIAAQIPLLSGIRVKVIHYVNRIGNYPDIAACFPSTKAAIDGLVDAGVIIDDDPEHLLRLDFLAPMTMPSEWKSLSTGALELTIEEVV